MAVAEKKDEQIFNVRNIVGLICLALFLGYLPFYLKKGRKLRRDHRYTTATIYKTHWSLKSGKFADSKFVVRNVTYTVSADADQLSGETLVGRRFLVKFHPPEPDIATLYLNAPIPDDVPAPPADGWDVSPVPVPDGVLR